MGGIPCRYSSRNATIGSSLVARHAGITGAANETAASNAGTAKNVATSMVLTLYPRAIICPSLRAKFTSGPQLDTTGTPGYRGDQV